MTFVWLCKPSLRIILNLIKSIQLEETHYSELPAEVRLCLSSHYMTFLLPRTESGLLAQVGDTGWDTRRSGSLSWEIKTTNPHQHHAGSFVVSADCFSVQQQDYGKLLTWFSRHLFQRCSVGQESDLFWLFWQCQFVQLDVSLKLKKTFSFVPVFPWNKSPHQACVWNFLSHVWLTRWKWRDWLLLVYCPAMFGKDSGNTARLLDKLEAL